MIIFLSRGSSIGTAFSAFTFSPLFSLSAKLLISYGLKLVISFPSFISALPLYSSLAKTSFASSMPFPSVSENLFMVLFAPSLSLMIISSLFSAFLIARTMTSLEETPPKE